MPTVTVHFAKTNLSKLIAQALQGEEVIIARNKLPTVRVVPIEQGGPRRAGSLKGRVALTPAFFEPLPADELAAWEGEHEGGS